MCTNPHFVPVAAFQNRERTIDPSWQCTKRWRHVHKCGENGTVRAKRGNIILFVKTVRDMPLPTLLRSKEKVGTFIFFSFLRRLLLIFTQVKKRVRVNFAYKFDQNKKTFCQDNVWLVEEKTHFQYRLLNRKYDFLVKTAHGRPLSCLTNHNRKKKTIPDLESVAKMPGYARLRYARLR